MLKNKALLATFHESIMVSLQTFQPTVMFLMFVYQ